MRLHWDPGGKSASMIPDGWNSLSAFALLLLFFVTVVFVVSLELPLQLSWWRICLRCTRPGFSPWVGKIPWRRKWPPTPAFLPGEPHGQRSLAGYGRWGRKEQDATDCAWAQQTVGANGPPDTMTGTCTSCHPAPFSSACRVWHSLLCFLPLVSLIVLLLSRSVVSDSAAPWTVARQAALSMGFSKQKYWSGLPCPPPGDLPNPGVKARSPALQVILYHLSHQGRPSLITEL